MLRGLEAFLGQWPSSQTLHRVWLFSGLKSALSFLRWCFSLGPGDPFHGFTLRSVGGDLESWVRRATSTSDVSRDPSAFLRHQCCWHVGDDLP